jgi:hypothetical protein
MTLLHNIRTVARYEAKILRRSWFFRLFSIGALIILTFMNIGLFSPIGDEDWSLVSIPSSLPLINLYLLNIGQSIVVIFLAADFLKRDKKVDTNEVLYTRSMSNFEYVIGKSWGILRLFLGLDIIVLTIGLVINIISKDMSVDIMSYLAYLLIICIPTILFSLGLAFVLMSVIRNQAITFLLLLGIAALNMFWLWYRLGSIFDYMAFGLPVVKSNIIGFDNLNLIVNQRLLYFFLGMALVMITVLLFKRLPQSKIHTTISVVLISVFLAGSVVCAFNTYSLYRNNLDEKKQTIETSRQFEERDFVRLTEADIDFSHKGKLLDASAEMKFINDNNKNLGSYLFSLNPGLKVTRVITGGKELNFKQTHHIIEIDPGRPLTPGENDSLVISYTGSINEPFCYPNYTDNIKETHYRIAMLNVNKRQAFLTEKYVLLTPEIYWYPVPGLNYYPSNPARIKVDFTNYTLHVKTGKGLVAVSQGIMKKENDTFVFRPESPLTGLTLAIGDYRSDTLKIDSVRYVSWYLTSNDYYKKGLSEIKDTLPTLVSGIMRELETSFSTKYPFNTLNLVEVPVQFYSYPKMSTQTRAELQPSMVLLPEKLSTLIYRGFSKQFTRQKKNMARQNQIITDKELQVRIFNSFVRNTFISGEDYRFVNGAIVNEPTRYRLGPSFYFFKNNFYSSEYPVINAVFESHLQKVIVPVSGYRNYIGDLSDIDKANLILKNGSFRDLLAKNPGGDTVRLIVTIKGDYLFNLIRSKTGIEEFKTWFQAYIDEHKFQGVDILTFNNDTKEKFGFEFYPYLNDWFNRKEQPGFLFTGLQAKEVVIDDRVRYLVTFTVSNPEPVAGIFNISFRTGGQGGPGRGGQMITTFQGGGGGGTSISISMQGRGMEASDISKIILMEPEEAKTIRIILDAEPRALLINTLFAKNIPGEINLPINEILKSKDKTKVTAGEEILASIPRFIDPNEIIVDNEDPGFIRSKQNTISPLKKLLGIKDNSGETYQQIRMMRAPEFWQPVVQSSYYGKYIRSSVYTRGSSGDNTVSWTAILDKPGYYDIYTYVGKTEDRITIRTGGAAPGAPPSPDSKGNSPYKDLHFKIYHDEGVDEITLDYENAESGWNNLGRYYLSPDTTKVELTNQSAGMFVIGDAVKWVKAN